MRRASGQQQTVTQLTRRDIFDYLSMEGISWHGRLEEVAFLERIWDLSSLPSTDGRFRNAARDIFQHRVNNPWDWEDDWVFTDNRFDLMHGPDQRFLEFLCEMVHPAVRPSQDEVEQLVAFFNEKLAADGWVLTAGDQMSGRPVYTAHRRMGAKQPGERGRSRHAPGACDCRAATGRAAQRAWAWPRSYQGEPGPDSPRTARLQQLIGGC